MQSPLLSMQSLTAGYGDANILFDLNLQVLPGEIVVIVGPNGAGKSTAMKAVFGLLKVQAGHIYFDNQEITFWQPNAIVQAGMCYVPQVDNVFREMSVAENLEMGAFLRTQDVAETLDHVYSLFPDLAEKRKTVAGALSGGQRQMVAMGRALMLHPKLLLLDEPTAGLSPKYMEQIFKIIQDVRKTGVAIMLVEQHAKQALALADRGYVLATGKNRCEDRGAALLANPEIAKMFLGG